MSCAPGELRSAALRRSCSANDGAAFSLDRASSAARSAQLRTQAGVSDALTVPFHVTSCSLWAGKTCLLGPVDMSRLTGTAVRLLVSENFR